MKPRKIASDSNGNRDVDVTTLEIPAPDFEATLRGPLQTPPPPKRVAKKAKKKK